MTPYFRLPGAIFDRFSAGDSLEETAEDFDLSLNETIELLRVACSARNRRKSKAELNKILARYVAGNPPQNNYHFLNLAAVYAMMHGYELPEWFYDTWLMVGKQVLFNALEAERKKQGIA